MQQFGKKNEKHDIHVHTNIERCPQYTLSEKANCRICIVRHHFYDRRKNKVHKAKSLYMEGIKRSFHFIFFYLLKKIVTMSILFFRYSVILVSFKIYILIYKYINVYKCIKNVQKNT